jgi:hypothetical protein
MTWKGRELPTSRRVLAAQSLSLGHSRYISQVDVVPQMICGP